MPSYISRTFVNVLDVAVPALQRKLFRIKLRFSRDPRPSSYPYLSGDSFRAIADHRHDETTELDPAAVKMGDSVFVGQERLIDFLTRLHPAITHQYVLICHNGDRPQIDSSITDLLDEKIVHFFAQDVLHPHAKVTPIPIGLENLHFHVAGIISVFDRLRKKIDTIPPRRRKRIFFNFSVSTNPPERGPAKAYFLQHPLMETSPRFLPPHRHNELLMQYMFVASPPGNAIESCRTWEALYLKTIPICKDFASFTSFRDHGLPIWIVHDWNELEGLSETDLAQKYESLMAAANWKPLFMDFWIDRISEQKRYCRF